MQEIKTLLQFVYPFWKKFVKYELIPFALICFIFIVQFSIPISTRNVIDSITQYKDISNFYLYLSLLTGLVLILSLCRWFYTVSVSWIGESFIIEVTSDVFSKILWRGKQFWLKYDQHDVVTRLTQDILSVKSFTIDFIHNVLLNSIIYTATLIFMLFISFKVGLVLAIASPIIFVQTYLGNKYLNEISRTIRTLASSFLSIFHKAIRFPEIIHSWDLQEYFFMEYRRTSQDMKSKQVSFISNMMRINQSMAFVAFLLGNIVILIVLKNEYLIGELTLGGIFSVLLYANQAIQTLMSIANSLVSGKLDRVAVSRIIEVTQYMDAKKERINPILQNYIHPFFKENLKNGIALPFQDKFIIHLNGRNGVGKSTYAHFLTGYDNLVAVLEGEKWFLIPSDPPIFLNTPLENIKIISKKNIEAKDVITALEKNNFYVLLSLFQNGLEDDRVQGNSFSRGQKQALVLMSAVLKNPANVIIDEGLNSLDVDVKARIKYPLLQWLEQRRSVVIEHGEFLFENNVAKAN